MKNYKTLLIILIALFTVSCIKDNTKSFNGDYDKYTINGIEYEYSDAIGERITINPTVKINHISDESELEYIWRLESDTVCYEKNLDMIIPGKYGKTISASFTVRDKKRDIRYSHYFVIKTISYFQKGWVVLSEKNEKGYLSFISATNNNKIYKDLYGNEFGKPMPKGKRIEFYGLDHTKSAIGVILNENPEETFFLEGDNLSYAKPLSALFKTMDYVEGHFKPENMCIDVTTAANNNMFVMTNKKIYVKPGSDSFDSSIFAAPVEGDYEVKDLYGSMGPMGESFVTYDYKNKRYIFIGSDDITLLRTSSTPISEGHPFDIANVDVTPLWMGYSINTPYSDNYFISIVKNNNTQKYQLHLFYLRRQRVDGIYSYVLKRIKLYDFPEGSYTPDTKVCAINNVMYLANGKDIYRMNLEVFGTIEHMVTLDKEITCIKEATDKTIAVGINSGNTEFPGDIYIISTETDNIGKVLNKFTGVGGIIKDMVYKFN